jgi:hypothetical protein
VIAGAGLLAADTPEEAWAATAHPEDDGSFIRYIPREKAARMYADHGEWLLCDDGIVRPEKRRLSLPGF